LSLEFLGAHTEKHAAGLDVLVSIVVRVKAGSGVEQGGNAALDADGSQVRRVHPGEYFQQSGLTSSVMPNQPKPIAIPQGERDIIERAYNDALLTACPLVPD